MLSDSLFEIIETLKEKYTYYNEEPFTYSRHYKKDIREAMIKLYEVLFTLDSAGFHSDEYVKELSVKEVDVFFSTQKEIEE